MSVLSTVCTGVRVVCEVARVVHSADRMLQVRGEREEMLRKASVGNRVFMLCMNAAEILAVYRGCSPETLYSIKLLESYGRLVDVGIKVEEAWEDHLERVNFEEQRGEEAILHCLRFMEQGVLAPLASVVRTQEELNIYETKCGLAMPPKELAKHKIGEKPRTVEDLTAKLEASESNIDFYRAAEAVFISGSATRVVGKTVRETQETSSAAKRLYRALRGHPPQQAEAAVAAENAINEADPLDLLAMPRIPAVLHNDPHLRYYMCPITQVPIRYAIGDPNGVTFYERAAIEQWIRQNGTSPVTRQHLTLADLRPAPVAQAFIDNRLQYYQGKLNAVMEEAAN